MGVGSACLWHALAVIVGGGVLLFFCGLSRPRAVECVFGVVCVHHESPSWLPVFMCGVFLWVGGWWWWWGLVVCVTSCEGHMVDALASRADEGRRSLR